jgi:hypothetical protein
MMTTTSVCICEYQVLLGAFSRRAGAGAHSMCAVLENAVLENVALQ